MVSLNNNPSKIKNSGFHVLKSTKINAPIIKELPFALECKLVSYDKKTGHTFGKIIGISADSKVINKVT